MDGVPASEGIRNHTEHSFASALQPDSKALQALPMPSDAAPITSGFEKPVRRDSSTNSPRMAAVAVQRATDSKLNATLARPSSCLTSNLICDLKLEEVAAGVARYDPQSGEKINKMRKSYDNHLKQLGLAGKNKSVKHADPSNAVGPVKMMGLGEMVAWPDEEWLNQKVSGRNIFQGISETIKGRLADAFQLNPGHVPDTANWEDILGTDHPNPSNANLRPDPTTRNPATTQGTSTKRPADTDGPNLSVDHDHIRARRNTKKRRYDDGSFEGYGEGYVDDEMEYEGYESGETHASRNSRGSKGERIKRRRIQEPGKDHAQSGPRGPRNGGTGFAR